MNPGFYTSYGSLRTSPFFIRQTKALSVIWRTRFLPEFSHNWKLWLPRASHSVQKAQFPPRKICVSEYQFSCFTDTLSCLPISSGRNVLKLIVEVDMSLQKLKEEQCNSTHFKKATFTLQIHLIRRLFSSCVFQAKGRCNQNITVKVTGKREECNSPSSHCPPPCNRESCHRSTGRSRSVSSFSLASCW